MLIDYQLENYEPIIYRGADIPIQAIQCKSDQVAVEDEGCYLDLEIANKRIDWLAAKFQFKPYRWQRDVLLRYYGWRKSDASYRFEYIICFIPKKNGKSFLVSAILGQKLWELEDGDLFSMAVNSKQAGIILDGVIKFFNQSKKMRQLMEAGKIKAFSSPARKEINNTLKRNKYIAMADSPKANDGVRAHCLIVDEIHRIENRAYDIVSGATANMPNALQVVISTSGDGDRTHCSFHQYNLAKQILSGEVVDTSVLPIIYEYADQKTRDKDKILSIEAMMSCNPILHEDEAARKKAERELVRERVNPRIDHWRRLRLNVWCQEDGDAFIDPDRWHELKIPRIPESELSQYPTFIGLDMSRCIDLTGITLWHELDDGRIYQQEIAIMPETQLLPASQKDDVDYCKFAENNELTVCDGKAISDEYVADLMLKLAKQYKVVGVGIDQQYADYVARKLEEAGIPLVMIQQQNNRQQTVGINFIEQLVIDGRICHAGSELYEWQPSCAKRITTAKDASKIVKKHSNRFGRGGKGRHDNVDAAISAALVFRHNMVEGDALEPFVY